MVIEGLDFGSYMQSILDRDENGDYLVRIGHSPDPDDAFMFHAMTNGKFATPGYKFVHELQMNLAELIFGIVRGNIKKLVLMLMKKSQDVTLVSQMIS